MNQNNQVEELQDHRLQASAGLRRKSEYFDYMVSEHAHETSTHAPYHILNRHPPRQRQVTPTLRAQTLVQTKQQTQPISIDGIEPVIYSHYADEEDVSLIDDHEPVPEFIHHPRWAIWFRPQRTFRFLINQAPMTGKSIIIASGFALGSRLLSFFQSQSLEISHLQNISWQLSFMAFAFLGLVFGSLLWKWERLVNTYLGKIFGGIGNTDNVGQALIWSYIPVSLSILMHVAGVLLFGESYLSTQGPLWITVTLIGLHLYGFFLGVILLAEAHRISWLRGMILRLISSAFVFGLPLAFYATNL
ncbi:MAG: Yip1 family protein [Oligoflexus sp.]